MHTKRPLLPYLLFGLKILPTNTNSNWKPVIAILSIHYQNWKKKGQFVSGNYCWPEQGFTEEFKIGIRLHFKQEALKSPCAGYLHVYTYIGWHALKIAFSQEWWAPVITKLTILPLIFSKLLPSIILPFVFHEVSSFFFLFDLFPGSIL